MLVYSTQQITKVCTIQFNRCHVYKMYQALPSPWENLRMRLVIHNQQCRALVNLLSHTDK